MADLSHCGEMIYTHDRDRFLLSLFATGHGREALQTVYALNAELMQIQGRVSEAVIGQMRLAWWQERIDALYEEKQTPGHPILEALEMIKPHVPKEMLVGLVDQYRECFPELPEIDNVMETISLHVVRVLCPESEPGWRKAKNIIVAHRKRHGNRLNSWMSFRLLTGF